jgi:hypothetical protein
MHSYYPCFFFRTFSHFLACRRESCLKKYSYVFACDNLMHFTFRKFHACIREYSLLCDALTCILSYNDTCVYMRFFENNVWLGWTYQFFKNSPRSKKIPETRVPVHGQILCLWSIGSPRWRHLAEGSSWKNDFVIRVKAGMRSSSRIKCTSNRDENNMLFFEKWYFFSYFVQMKFLYRERKCGLTK